MATHLSGWIRDWEKTSPTCSPQGVPLSWVAGHPLMGHLGGLSAVWGTLSSLWKRIFLGFFALPLIIGFQQRSPFSVVFAERSGSVRDGRLDFARIGACRDRLAFLGSSYEGRIVPGVHVDKQVIRRRIGRKPPMQIR